MPSLNMIDWQTAANIATVVVVIISIPGLIITIGAFIWEVKSSRREREFSIFLRLIDSYREIMADRRKRWKVIKERVRANPRTSEEIGDRTSSLDYLLTRVQQEEALYAIEHAVIEDEIRSLNLLNELCKYALRREEMALILKVSFSSEISYYQNRVEDLLFIRSREKQFRLFSIPHYDHLQKFQVAEYFEDISRNGG